ncbi:DinB family protein [candidate division KSB1 bacterium]
MDGKTAAGIVRNERKYLQNIIKDFKPENGGFNPVEGMLTVAQQINHIAHTILWFREGAFGSGFEMDPAVLEKQVMVKVSFEESLKKLNDTYDNWIAFLEGLSEEELNAPLPENSFFGPLPKSMIIYSNFEHTAHHRGALSVYLRLLGIKPTMVYMG